MPDRHLSHEHCRKNPGILGGKRLRVPANINGKVIRNTDSERQKLGSNKNTEMKIHFTLFYLKLPILGSYSNSVK